MYRVHLSVPHMSGHEEEYVHRAFVSNWLSTVGPNITALEQEFASRLGRPTVALASGTAAIHLALRLVGVKPGDEVFCSTLTFVASANAVRYLGAEPVFVDSDYDTWNLDPNLLYDTLRERAKRNHLPRALIVVHLYGQCADMDPIRKTCEHYGISIIEDAAEALGATYKSRPAGTLADVAAFSLNGNKIITTTGGGLLVTSDEQWASKVRFWASQAREPGIAYDHTEIGYNYRMSNVLAGIGRAQLGVLDLRVEQRRTIAFRYRDGFSDLPGITLMPQARYGLHTNWLSCFLIDADLFGTSRDDLRQHLERNGIESRPVWKPMHLQPLYAGCQVYGGSVAADLFHRGICLPSSSSLALQDQLFVINQVRAMVSATPLTASEEVRPRVMTSKAGW